MRRVLRILAGLTILLVVGVAILLAVLLRGTLPEDPAALRVDGLEAPVSIRFDHRGRPWVEALSLGDAMFAQGWLHVRDRAWQMELLRRAGRGRLAEMLGPDLVAADAELIRAGVPRLARTLEANADPDTLELVDAWVAGANARLRVQRPAAPEFLLLDHEVAPLTRRDVFAVGAIMAWDSAGNADHERLRAALAAELDPDRFRAFLPGPPAEADFPYVVQGGVRTSSALLAGIGDPAPARPSLSLGSSGWVVAPGRSRSGDALFAFDSHDGWTMPSLLYEVHHFIENDADGPRQLRGWTAPGLPGVINGFNDFVAWGLTNIGDSQDLFLEQRDPEDPRRFLGRSGWYRAEVRREQIPVAGGETRSIEVITTENGPLVQEDPPLSLAWTGHHLKDAGLDGLFELNRATDLRAFHAALDRFAAPSANVTWADRDGHIGSRVVGRLPIRGQGRGLLPLPASEPGSGWQGFVAAQALPRATNPPRGFLAAANARVNPPGSGPLVSADNAPGYRMRRLVQVLEGNRLLGPEEMQALQTDFGDTQAQRLLPVLLSRVEAGALDESGARALELLDAWSAAPSLEADSAAALIWAQWYQELIAELLGSALSPPLLKRLEDASYPLNHALDGLLLALPTLAGDADPAALAWWGADPAGRITTAFRRAVGRLIEAYGEEVAAWRWDAAHRLRFRHELGSVSPVLDRMLSRGPWPWGGGNPTPGRARYRYHTPFEARGGASVRVVIRMSEPMRVRAVIAGGQSGHFLSPHYDDQFETWLAGELEQLPDRPEKAGNVRTRLEPR